MLNRKLNATETVSSLIVHGIALEIPDTFNDTCICVLSTVNRLGVSMKDDECTIKEHCQLIEGMDFLQSTPVKSNSNDDDMVMKMRVTNIFLAYKFYST
jgi:hypothetical protein